jgi:anti-sigma regulatory factor (Ser/Thr protein kinase)
VEAESTATTGHNEARTRLSSHPTSAAAARRFVRDVLNRWQAGDSEASVLLCTDELVTNAIVHVCSDIEVVVRLDRRVLRVEVHDRSARPPLRRPVAADADTGRGLHLVDALSNRWGVDSRVDGWAKSVWFEVQSPAACP